MTRLTNILYESTVLKFSAYEVGGHDFFLSFGQKTFNSSIFLTLYLTALQPIQNLYNGLTPNPMLSISFLQLVAVTEEGGGSSSIQGILTQILSRLKAAKR